jgi:hypothetical protein
MVARVSFPHADPTAVFGEVQLARDDPRVFVSSTESSGSRAVLGRGIKTTFRSHQSVFQKRDPGAGHNWRGRDGPVPAAHGAAVLDHRRDRRKHARQDSATPEPPPTIPDDVRRLVASRIRSRAELDALLLVFHTREQAWTDRDVAPALRLQPDAAGRVLFDLMAQGFLKLVNHAPLAYRFLPASPELTRVVSDLATAYAASPDAVRRLIRPPAPRSVREFADAFRLLGEEEGAP